MCKARQGKGGCQTLLHVVSMARQRATMCCNPAAFQPVPNTNRTINRYQDNCSDFVDHHAWPNPPQYK
ncbi:hypothetical protein HZ326_9305 [Fusarium oxysporum f. sp. albedinis]|nr:hypothetical protein HZ326_9305 [Fusarium oxysporum f. sp. albedinis]